jgi:Putative Flp pilus-assembly TadE/G-like
MTPARLFDRRSRAQDQSGQITAMLVLFSISLLLAIIAVTDVSAGYLRRQSATSLADGAALAASDGAAAAGIYQNPSDQFVVISQPAAEAAVDSYLRKTSAYATYPGLHVDVVSSGHTVTVYLSMPYQLPVPVPGVPRITTIHATGASEMPIY